MFCMLLRKHLMGAKLAEITQPPMERAATFTFDCTDEMGFPVQKRLVAELMGRTCNLYLLGPDGRILDCLRRIGLDESAKRAALPGLMYQEPEAVTKLNPRSSVCQESVPRSFDFAPLRSGGQHFRFRKLCKLIDRTRRGCSCRPFDGHLRRSVSAGVPGGGFVCRRKYGCPHGCV